MIAELTNFVQDLPSKVFTYNVDLEEGLYFEVDVTDDNEPAAG